MILSKRHILFGGEAIISHFQFKPPLVASGEMKNEACFIFPINTMGDTFRQDGKQKVTDSDGVLMKCGPYINKWEAVDEKKNAEVVIIRLLPDVLKHIFDIDLQRELTRSSKEEVKHASSEILPLGTLLEKYLESLFFYFDHPHLVSDELLFLKVKELCILLVRTPQSNKVKKLLSTLFEPEKFSLVDVVNSNYLEDLSIKEFAELSNMSVATYQRKFKKLIGQSPSIYIREKRIALAEVQLKESKKPISEIAYNCGFSDPNYFAKVFAKKHGISPSKYRMVNSQ